jgi:hypothetical protein
MAEQGTSRPNGLPSAELRIKQERIFQVRQLFTSIASGNARSIVLSNPADSDISLLTISPNFASSAESWAEKIENPTIDTAGTSLSVQNKNVGGTRTATATAETNGSYSGGTSRGRDVVGSSAGGGGAGGSVGEADLALEIPPGNSVQYSLESRASANNLSISLSWVEDPV